MSRLEALSPGTIAAPSSPPASRLSRVSMLSPPLSRPRAWHRVQLARRMGAISRVKSMGWAAGAGRPPAGACAKSAPEERSRADAAVTATCSHRVTCTR